MTNPYSGSSDRSPVDRYIKVVLGAVLLFLVVSSGVSSRSDRSNGKRKMLFRRDKSRVKEPLKIVFVGNAIPFGNDCPGLLVQMLEASEQNLTMTKLFDAATRRWDFAILGEETTAPAKPDTQVKTLEALNRTFAQELWETRSTPVFLEAAGYRQGHPDFGNFEQFTALLQNGHHLYANALTYNFRHSQSSSNRKRPKEARVCPVGEAYAEVKSQDERLWERLYMQDGMQPSALGTWLQACVLYATMLNEEPPKYNPDWWKTGPGSYRTSDTLPTEKEATDLWSASLKVTGIMDDQFYVEHSDSE